MKVGWPLLSLLRRLVVVSLLLLLLMMRGPMLLSDCEEEVELERLSSCWVDIVFGLVVIVKLL